MHDKTRHSKELKEEMAGPGLKAKEWTNELIAREIYENISQVLSLVNIQLNELETKESGESAEVLAGSNRLLQKAIRDLRLLGRQLAAKEITETGFLDSLLYELDRLKEANICMVSVKLSGLPFRIEPDRELMVFSLLQQILKKVLDETDHPSLACAIRCFNEKMTVTFQYETADAYGVNNEISPDPRFRQLANFSRTVPFIRKKGKTIQAGISILK